MGLCYGSLPGRRLKSFNDTCPGLADIVREIKSNEHVLRLRHTSCLSSRKHKSNPPVLFMQIHITVTLLELPFNCLGFKALHDNM